MPSPSKHAPLLRRIGLVAAALLLAALALWALRPRPAQVDAAVASRGPIRAAVEEQAMTRLPRVHTVSMPVDGRVLPIDLVEGDRVSAGQTVARMEPDDLLAAVAAAEARAARARAAIAENDDDRLERTLLEQVEAVLVSIDRTVESAEERTRASSAGLEYYTTELRRLEEASERGAATEAELRRARLDAVDSEVDHRTTRLTLAATLAVRVAAQIAPRFIVQYIETKDLRRAVLEQDLREAEADLERLRRDLARAEIASPADGVVLARAVSSLAYLPAGAALLEIGTLADLEVEAEVLSEEAARLREGMPVDVAGPAVGEPPLAGTVERVYPQGFRKVSSLGVEQQRVLVIIAFDEGQLDALAQRGRRLGADYRVRVRIYTDARDDALRIPRSAVFRGPDGAWQTFAVRDGRAALVNLELGLRDETLVEVVSGLSAGDAVILAPDNDLRDGDRVRIATLRAGADSQPR